LRTDRPFSTCRNGIDAEPVTQRATPNPHIVLELSEEVALKRRFDDGEALFTLRLANDPDASRRSSSSRDRAGGSSTPLR
jgi:hypothetical protein